MVRYITLVIVDFVLLSTLASVFEISESTPIAAAIAYTLNPLAFPAEWLAQRWPARGLLIVVSAFMIGPLVWAAVVESLLRRFVDRPKDSDAE